ncbi:MAG: sugar translocase [Tatlockia sp.]|nr:sugar translocase [Tatlockia sp.]
MEKRIEVENPPFWQSLRLDWKWILAGSIFCFFYASALFSGWHAGLKAGFIPNLNYPYVYGADSIFMSWEIQRVLEGWIFDNSRSGYPFGSIFFDYPQADNGNLVILKLFSLVTGTFYGALNLYLLTSFVVVFAVSFLVFRALSFRAFYAFSAAILFSFAPFHMWRLLGHIYYTWYFVVPIYCLLGWKIFFNAPLVWPLNNLKKISILLATLIVLSSFGVYYAFFGVITFIVSGIAAAISQNKLQGFYASLFLTAMLAFGVGLNLLPTAIYKFNNGPNREAGYRLLKETETYSLKIAPLFLPIWNHRVDKIKSIFWRYTNNFDVTEATFSSSLGLIGSLGLIILILCIFKAALGKQIDIRLRYLSFLILAYLLIASVGGFNVFFALYISKLIRGWNRISIFISFATLTTVFFLLQENKTLEFFHKNNKLIFNSFVALLLIFGLLDQTPLTLAPQTYAAKEAFKEDRIFISRLESSLPPGSAIYQLPYMGFPEYGPYKNLADYDLLRGFVNSKTLKWSHAGIKGREGDLFYRKLFEEPLVKQLDVIKRLGFSGIYIDRRGFSDNANDLIKQLNQLLGYQPSLESQNKQIVFYPIKPFNKLVSEALKPSEIMRQARYFTSNDKPLAKA